MARQPWWQATKTLEQSKRSAILYLVLAGLAWAVAPGGDSGFTWLVRIALTGAGLYFLAAWCVRRSRARPQDG